MDEHELDEDARRLDSDEELDVHVDNVLQAAMNHIDEMKFRFFETDAQAQRAKTFAQDIIRDWVSPAVSNRISRYIAEHPDGPINVEALIKPIMSALDRIATEKTERAYRC